MKSRKSKTCCFKGNKNLPKEEIRNIVLRMDKEIDRLIDYGVTEFICGGEIGFDQIAASLIIAKKEMGKDIRLIFALTCKNQDEDWSVLQKKLFYSLLSEADEIIYVCNAHCRYCIKKRNKYMVDNSAYCICVNNNPLGETAQTIKLAKSKGLKVINVSL